MPSSDWPDVAWQAMNRLAELDLAHYPKHVFDREAFLGTARAKRHDQHKPLVDRLLAEDPNITADELVVACNPSPLSKDSSGKEAKAHARIWDRNDRFRAENPLPDPPSTCPTCFDSGMSNDQPCACSRGRFRVFIRQLQGKEAV